MEETGFSWSCFLLKKVSQVCYGKSTSVSDSQEIPSISSPARLDPGQAAIALTIAQMHMIVYLIPEFILKGTDLHFVVLGRMF